MGKLLKCFVIFYVLTSFTMSLLYNAFPKIASDIAFHRNGLIIVSIDTDGIWLLNPLSNFTDDWM